MNINIEDLVIKRARVRARAQMKKLGALYPYDIFISLKTFRIKLSNRARTRTRARLGWGSTRTWARILPFILDVYFKLIA